VPLDRIPFHEAGDDAFFTFLARGQLQGSFMCYPFRCFSTVGLREAVAAGQSGNRAMLTVMGVL
jgi:hypothetical protein